MPPEYKLEKLFFMRGDDVANIWISPVFGVNPRRGYLISPRELHLDGFACRRDNVRAGYGEVLGDEEACAEGAFLIEDAEGGCFMVANPYGIIRW